MDCWPPARPVPASTSDEVAQIQEAGEAIAAKVIDEQHRDFLIPCKPAAADKADPACAEKFLSATGRLWFRRPLEQASLKTLVAQAGQAADKLHDFYAGLGGVLNGMLVSPQALYVIDTAEADPAHAAERRLDAYSMASRLSFFLWNSAPDDALLTAAEKGELATREGRAKVVDAMLASPRLEAGMRAFFDDMLSFNDFDSLSKDPQVYPAETRCNAGGCARTDAAHHRRSAGCEERGLPRPVHLARHVHVHEPGGRLRRVIHGRGLAALYFSEGQSARWAS